MYIANWAAAAALALLLSASYLLDQHNGTTPTSTEHAQATSVDDAIKTEARAARHAKAAAAICGNGGYVETDGGGIRCIRHNERRASVLQVAGVKP